MRSAGDKAARFAEAAPITMDLPWPPTALSPNVRQHWVPFAKAKALYRDLCSSVVSGMTPPLRVPSGALTLTVEACAPTKRRYDRDNILSRMKAGLDGVCSALQFDDSRFDSITIRMLPSQGRPGFVRITIGLL